MAESGSTHGVGRRSPMASACARFAITRPLPQSTRRRARMPRRVRLVAKWYGGARPGACCRAATGPPRLLASTCRNVSPDHAPSRRICAMNSAGGLASGGSGPSEKWMYGPDLRQTSRPSARGSAHSTAPSAVHGSFRLRQPPGRRRRPREPEGSSRLWRRRGSRRRCPRPALPKGHSHGSLPARGSGSHEG